MHAPTEDRPQAYEAYDLVGDVRAFVNGVKIVEPRHVLKVEPTTHKANAEKNDRSLEQQLETFASDVEKMARGAMTYSEMRSRYG